MKPRELMVVLLRVLGIWQLINGLVVLATLLQVLTRIGGNRVPPLAQLLWPFAAPSTVHLVAGVLLLLLANPIARWFYPIDREDEDSVEPRAPGPLARRWAETPKQVRLGLGIFMAVVLPMTSIALSTPEAPLLVTMGSALHTLLLVGIACAAIAYLLRRRWKPIPSFFVMLIAIFALTTLLNAMRRIL